VSHKAVRRGGGRRGTAVSLAANSWLHECDRLKVGYPPHCFSAGQHAYFRCDSRLISTLAPHHTATHAKSSGSALSIGVVTTRGSRRLSIITWAQSTCLLRKPSKFGFCILERVIQDDPLKPGLWFWTSDVFSFCLSVALEDTYRYDVQAERYIWGRPVSSNGQATECRESFEKASGELTSLNWTILYGPDSKAHSHNSRMQ